MNVLLLFGGTSSEHEISIRSAKTVAAGLEEAGHHVLYVGIDMQGEWWQFRKGIPSSMSVVNGDEYAARSVTLMPRDKKLNFCFGGRWCRSTHGIDVVFPVLHGAGGEDGTIQGYLETIGIPYVGCNQESSALCMNKVLTKKMLPPRRIVPYVHAHTSDASILDYGTLTAMLGERMFIKPARSGSSVGISRVTCEEEFMPAIRAACAQDNIIVIERAMVAREMECAVLETREGIRVAGPGEIITPDGFYSYDEKYSGTSKTRVAIPARVTPDEAEKMRRIARETFMQLGCRGLARVDMFMSSGSVLVNEVNTMPGFTSISMYPKLFGYEGIPLPQLVQLLLDNALNRA